MKAEAAYPQTRINKYIIGKHGNKTTKAKDTRVQRSLAVGVEGPSFQA